MIVYLILGFIISIIYTILWIHYMMLKLLNIEEYDTMTWKNDRMVLPLKGFGYNKILNRILVSSMVSLYLIFVWPWLIIGWILYWREF